MDSIYLQMLKESRSVLHWQGLVSCSIVRPGANVPWQTRCRACLVLSVFIYGLAVDIALTAALPLRAVSLRAWYALDHFFYLPLWG